jgi:DNA-binding MarR family transcriptional regulator
LRRTRRYGIGRLLLLARRDFIARLAIKMNGEADSIMLSRGRLLPCINVNGTRSVDLARRMGVTKQAVARMVRELEDEGLLTREAVDADGQAALVRFTAKGLDYMTQMHRCITQVERDYESLFGREKMTVVHETLGTIAYADEGTSEPAAARDM